MGLEIPDEGGQVLRNLNSMRSQGKTCQYCHAGKCKEVYFHQSPS